MTSVYILRSERNGRYYTGYALDVSNRLLDHNQGRVKATRYLRPWVLVYVETHNNATSARKREYQIKSMKSRIYIEQQIAQQNAPDREQEADLSHISSEPTDDSSVG